MRPLHGLGAITAVSSVLQNRSLEGPALAGDLMTKTLEVRDGFVHGGLSRLDARVQQAKEEATLNTRHRKVCKLLRIRRGSQSFRALLTLQEGSDRLAQDSERTLEDTAGLRLLGLERIRGRAHRTPTDKLKGRLSLEMFHHEASKIRPRLNPIGAELLERRAMAFQNLQDQVRTAFEVLIELALPSTGRSQDVPYRCRVHAPGMEKVGGSIEDTLFGRLSFCRRSSRHRSGFTIRSQPDTRETGRTLSRCNPTRAKGRWGIRNRI